ncbi:MAG TPA: SEC-C metal-binding domain-containing protein [Phycisphaerae bacterium]|nr:SEC-C metal-binding domain-containing protein [Phycisphaerae bacterium]
MTVAVDVLPWQSLQLQRKEIPWQDLQALADAAVESPLVLDELIRRGEAELMRQARAERYDASDLTDLGAVVVFVLAAERLNEEARRPVADFLLRMLKRASETGLDYLEEAAERAAGRLGPILIEPLLQLIESESCRLHCWFSAWALLCVSESADPATRQRVARFCRRMIRECPDRFETRSLALGPAWVLEALNDRDSLPLLKALYEQSLDVELLHVIQRLEHGQGARVPRAWHVPVEDWLPDTIATVREDCEAERRALESAPSTTPSAPAHEPEEEANYAADWKQWLPTRREPSGDGKTEHAVPVFRDEPKHGRNEPCPCGSGKKYKKCCGR